MSRLGSHSVHRLPVRQKPISLPQPPKCGNYRHATPLPAFSLYLTYSTVISFDGLSYDSQGCFRQNLFIVLRCHADQPKERLCFRHCVIERSRSHFSEPSKTKKLGKNVGEGTPTPRRLTPAWMKRVLKGNGVTVVQMCETELHSSPTISIHPTTYEPLN